ncbi:MAG: hypothetical protein AAB527_00905 [Patescibacteria group bacterium]
MRRFVFEHALLGTVFGAFFLWRKGVPIGLSFFVGVSAGAAATMFAVCAVFGIKKVE